ncbi:MAG: lactate utilization protein [Chloroflexi bacterium]|nr:lactate utilization protein [Chloroflexota bacterium]MBM3172340.1 lactate utilization protein [Chloroflexota bacterium]MBM3175051.1 lactate utilization protein [Chloroflexota bacterium]MBM4449922.1 lactate utilization protein [Chloroflexota bacterium]
MTTKTAQLIEQFKASVSLTGAILHQAKDAQDAREYILKLAQERNVKNMVKSKSATANGIQLIRHLEKAGINTTETDPDSMINTVADNLRQDCINADLGISEADFAIAETGTLVLIGNQRDVRLVAVLPRFHLTLVNSQNLVETLDDASAIIKSLSPGNTNCKMPAYVTYITGRNTTADIPGAIFARAQGPAEEHIVLLHKPSSQRGAP